MSELYFSGKLNLRREVEPPKQETLNAILKINLEVPIWTKKNSFIFARD